MRIERSLSLRLIGLFLLLAAIGPALTGEPQEVGRTYNQAQSLQWLDDARFAVGRWDGSISVFRRPISQDEPGPVMVQVMTTPSKRGVEMVDVLPSGHLVSSNTEGSLAVWTRRGVSFLATHIVRYDAAAGSFNSGCVVRTGERQWYVSGHSNGWVIRWRISKFGSMVPETRFDVRSPDPIQWRASTSMLALADHDIRIFLPVIEPYSHDLSP